MPPKKIKVDTYQELERKVLECVCVTSAYATSASVDGGSWGVRRSPAGGGSGREEGEGAHAPAVRHGAVDRLEGICVWRVISLSEARARHFWKGRMCSFQYRTIVRQLVRYLSACMRIAEAVEIARYINESGGTAGRLQLQATPVDSPQVPPGLEFFDKNSWTYSFARLKQLYLLGCEQLHRVELQRLPGLLDELYLDNYNNTCSVDRSSPSASPLNNHIEVDGGNHRSLIEEESFRKFMRFAESLFVHENTSALAVDVSMSSLKCFRIENRPNMEFVFADWDKGGDNVLVKLESMWLSHLPRLDAIRKRGIMVVPESYSQLKHIYLEFCTRLKYVLPSLSESDNLETIDIRYCGDLRAIYDGGDKRGAVPKLLPNLRSIHLEELPKLQHIYKPNICAPSLQDIVIRGCSSLRKLSLFDRSDGRSKRVVKISCEKDWWANLKWDEPEANYRSFLFDHKHCPCYKKPMKARWL
uniref:Disease resistance protein At4g27190-like leucine-rich repeats domain-containing protein n=1 Tax=Ananas comosus var. bracteatus TaxID=296719 RepID=A0A6V7QDF8_ANACO|nr:unnamed protein product [Ananas comosus var. bracteatus]